MHGYCHPSPWPSRNHYVLSLDCVTVKEMNWMWLSRRSNVGRDHVINLDFCWSRSLLLLQGLESFDMTSNYEVFDYIFADICRMCNGRATRDKYTVRFIINNHSIRLMRVTMFTTLQLSLGLPTLPSGLGKILTHHQISNSQGS